MNRTRKYAVVLVAGVALGLLPVKIALCVDGPRDQSAKGTDSWNDGMSFAGGLLGELAFRDGDDFGPPGPPPDGDHDRRPPPPRGGRGPDADRHQPPGPPRDGDRDRPRLGPPDGDRRGPGMPGEPGPMGTCGMGMPMPMGPEPGPDLEFMKDHDPEMYKVMKEDRDLEHRTMELVTQYRRASGDERTKIKQQLEETVNKHFDVRQQRRTLELKRLEGELQRLRETIDRREKARKEIVEKRVTRLLGTERELDF